MKKFCVTMLAVALLASSWGTSASAAVLFWGMDVSDDWFDAANWTPDGINAAASIPGFADHAIIHQGLGSPAIQPLITGAVAPLVNILTPSWFDGHSTSLDIGPGGSVNVLSNGAAVGFTRLSAGNSSTSTVTFHPGAGVSVWGILQMSFNNANGGQPLPGTEGDSFINLNGGILHLGALGFSNNGLNTTNIDIEGVAQLLVNGDHRDTGSGNATAWINAGYLSAYDGTGVVNVDYDVTNGRTVFTATAIPEPASLALLGLGCLAGLLTRKQH